MEGCKSNCQEEIAMNLTMGYLEITEDGAYRVTPKGDAYFKEMVQEKLSSSVPEQTQWEFFKEGYQLPALQPPQSGQ
jgi:hypothetical protein